MRALALAGLLAVGPALAAPPATGRYEATLCVATVASAPPACGPAELEVRSPAQMRMRVADIVYRLQLRPSTLDVLTMQGTMQIDGFSADYAWRDQVLSFVDGEKQARYELRVGARIRPGR